MYNNLWSFMWTVVCMVNNNKKYIRNYTNHFAIATTSMTLCLQLLWLYNTTLARFEVRINKLQHTSAHVQVCVRHNCIWCSGRLTLSADPGWRQTHIHTHAIIHKRTSRANNNQQTLHVQRTRTIPYPFECIIIKFIRTVSPIYYRTYEERIQMHRFGVDCAGISSMRKFRTNCRSVVRRWSQREFRDCIVVTQRHRSGTPNWAVK